MTSTTTLQTTSSSPKRVSTARSTTDGFIDLEDTDPNIPIGSNGKPQDSYFRHWPLERRIEKYNEFNAKFDLRVDPDLVDGFSHRLHWDEHPAVWRLRDADLTLEERIAITIHWSFSNEKWTNLVTLLDDGWDALEGLFAELLDITRIDTGGVEVNPQPLRMKELFGRLRLHFEPIAFEKGLMLTFRGGQNVVFGDPVLIERVLRNLVSNAIRYTDDGGVLVSCRQIGRAHV